jgi:hypothetical protein
MKYLIVEGDSYPELENKVNNLCEDNKWRPQGGVAVVQESLQRHPDKGHQRFFQAVVQE